MDNATFVGFTKLSVFSLNVWGLPNLLATDKDVRLIALGQYLVKKDYDIVCLQELWSEYDFIQLKTACKNKLPYVHYFLSGVFGSGLCIMSKWPILKTFFMQWSVNGYCHMIHHGDWFGGKGVALAQIKINNMFVNVYNTHLIANYSCRDCYLTHRVIQALDTALFLDLTSTNSDLSILCGDLNASPTNICTKLIKNLSNFEDSINAANKNGYELFGTNSTYKNTYSSIDNIESQSSGTRIDYIFYKCGSNYKIKITDYDLPLLMKIPGLNISYSDHEAVEANFIVYKTLTDVDSQNLSIADTSSDISSLLKEALEICSSGEQTVTYNCTIYSRLALLLITLLIINQFPVPVISYAFVLIIIYLIFLSTIWYCIEKNAIVSAKRRIQVLANTY